MDTINETNVRFRGKALLDLTHEETREALIQALNEVAKLQGDKPPTLTWAAPPSEEAMLKFKTEMQKDPAQPKLNEAIPCSQDDRQAR